MITSSIQVVLVDGSSIQLPTALPKDKLLAEVRLVLRGLSENTGRAEVEYDLTPGLHFVLPAGVHSAPMTADKLARIAGKVQEILAIMQEE